jgi:hypothetical protein
MLYHLSFFSVESKGKITKKSTGKALKNIKNFLLIFLHSDSLAKNFKKN